MLGQVSSFGATLYNFVLGVAQVIALTGGAVLGAGRERAAAALPHGLPHALPPGEKEAKLAQKLDQLQPFVAACRQKCMGQLASFGPT